MHIAASNPMVIEKNNSKDDVIKKAVTNIDLKGRLQEIKHGKLKEYAKNNRLIVDGGHNVNAANSLVRWINTLNEDVHLILGMMKDKDHQGYVNTFKGKIGVFNIEDNKINHKLNFYQIEKGELKSIF